MGSRGGRGGTRAPLSLSSLRPTSDRRVCGQWPPAPPKMCQCAQWENRRMRGRNAQCTGKRTRQPYQGFESSVVGKIFSEHSLLLFLLDKSALISLPLPYLRFQEVPSSVIMLFSEFKDPGDIWPLFSTQPLKLPGVLAAIPCPGVTRLVS